MTRLDNPKRERNPAKSRLRSPYGFPLDRNRNSCTRISICFLSGKNCHRCKRIHPLLAAAMERLHLQQFITTLEEVYGNEIKTIVNSFTFEDLGATLKDPILTLFLNKYEVFRTKTLRREYGSTAQYLMYYVSLVGLYHKFSRSVRTGDFQLFRNSNPDFISMLFVFKHHNYDRWLT